MIKSVAKAGLRRVVFEGPVNVQEVMSRLGVRYGCGLGRQPWVLGVRKGERFRLCVYRDKAGWRKEQVVLSLAQSGELLKSTHSQLL